MATKVYCGGCDTDVVTDTAAEWKNSAEGLQCPHCTYPECKVPNANIPAYCKTLHDPNTCAQCLADESTERDKEKEVEMRRQDNIRKANEDKPARVAEGGEGGLQDIRYS